MGPVMVDHHIRAESGESTGDGEADAAAAGNSGDECGFSCEGKTTGHGPDGSRWQSVPDRDDLSVSTLGAVSYTHLTLPTILRV